MLKVLIFEDETSLQPALRQILKPYSVDIRWESRVEGPSLLIQQDWDLVLSDYDLKSQLSGMDLWIASHRARPRTPFILMSGYPGDVFQQLLSMGVPCPPFLLKPFTSAQCRQMVEPLLKKTA